MSFDKAIGIDVGGTNLRVGVVSAQDVIWEKRFQADFSRACRNFAEADALSYVIENICSGISEALVHHPDACAIGIGFPGFIDPKSHVIAQSPNLPNLFHIDLTAPLENQFTLPVVIENDALAAAYGEHLVENEESLIYLGLGTGIGGGLVLNGKPYSGQNGVAMEIGHIIVESGGRKCGCGNSGCLEQYSSTAGLIRNYAELEKKADLSAKEIFDLAHNGNAGALKSFDIAGEKLAVALSHILKVIDVSTVIIGGGMSASWPLLLPAFSKKLERDLIPALRGKTNVRVSRSRDLAGMIGAAKIASEKASIKI